MTVSGSRVFGSILRTPESSEAVEEGDGAGECDGAALGSTLDPPEEHDTVTRTPATRMAVHTEAAGKRRAERLLGP